MRPGSDATSVINDASTVNAPPGEPSATGRFQRNAFLVPA